MTACDEGISAVLRPVEMAHLAEEVDAGEENLLGLVMPTHGFTAPWSMLRFALRLPRRGGTHAMVVATRAGLKIGPVYTPGIEGTGTAIVALILALKGYRIRGAVGVDMPSNWLAVHPGLSPQAVAGIVGRAEGRVADLMDHILSGGRRFRGWMPLLIGLYFFQISLGYLLVGRLFLAKMFYASERCTGCELCAVYCPNGGIKLVGSGEHRRPYWTFRCESCMRCMAYCPTRAVEANYLLGVGVYVLAAAIPTATILSWLTAWIPGLAWLSGIPGFALETVYAVGILGLAYPLFHLLLGIGWVNRLLTLVTPTHYYRRYHVPEAALGDLRRSSDS